METTLFTLEQANKMLPLIKSITANIVEAWAGIIEKRKKIEEFGALNLQRLELLKEEINHFIDRLNGYIKEIEDLGCFVEEFRRGIINLPSLSNGRRVFLNWYPGDQSISYFHELDETFKDRCPMKQGIFSGTPRSEATRRSV